MRERRGEQMEAAWTCILSEKKGGFILGQVASSDHRSTRAEDIRGGALTGSLKFFHVQEYILHRRHGAADAYRNSGRSPGEREGRRPD